MLQILRNKSQSIFIQIIVVIIALVFIFWGVGANLSGKREAALVVNGEKISFEEFEKAYDRAYQRLSDQFGGNVPKGLAETFGIKQQVINQLIQTSLLRQGAEEMGIRVSSEEIRQIIAEMVQFQDNGHFSEDRYKTVLSANRMAPTKFEGLMRIDHLSQIAAREIGNFATIATDFEVQEVYSQINEKIALKFVKISPDLFSDKVEVTDELLEKWFETAQNNYKTDPEIKIKYLVFSNADVGSKIEIDRAKITQYYQDNLDKFTVAEQRRARHILFKTEENDSIEKLQEQSAKAEEILRKARSGESFADLAKQYSEGPSKVSGGDLGFFSRGRMVPTFDKAIFSLKEGEISDVVKTRFGYHIILLEAIKPQTTKPLDAVEAEIIKTLQNKEAQTLSFQLANDAYESIISAGSLTKYAEGNPEAKIKESDFFNKSHPPAGLKNDPIFIEKSFALNKGELSSLVKGQSGYAIFYVEDIKTPKIPEFNAVKDTLTDDYVKAESVKLAEKSAQELLSTIAEGKEFDVAAKEMKLDIEESGFVGRNSQNNKTTFPSSLIENAFMLSGGAPLPKEPGKVGNDFYIYSLLDRQIPTLPENSAEIAKYRNNLLAMKQRQLLSAWLRNLEIDAEISQHQSL